VEGQNLSVRVGQSLDVELVASDPDGDVLSYAFKTPAHGTLVGSGPTLTYLPGPGFYGTDSFEVSASDGTNVSEPATIRIAVLRRTVYLRAGASSDGLADVSLGVVSTAQAAVDAAIAAIPSAQDPVLIDVGVGTFGDVTLTSAFGENVFWTGAGPSASVVGNILASGNAGVAAVYDLDSNLITPGAASGNGRAIVLNGDAQLSFGAVRSDGGHAADDSGCSGSWFGAGGAAGSVRIGAATRVASVSAKGGNAGTRVCTGGGAPAGAGGRVEIGAGAQVGAINVTGGTSSLENFEASAGEAGDVEVATGAVVGAVTARGGTSLVGLVTGGSGGEVVLYGTASSIDATGGENGVGVSGAGGRVVIRGSVGSVLAKGGSGADLGGLGGQIEVYGTAGNVDASGGSSGRAAGHGGTVHVHATGVASDVIANGGGGVGGYNDLGDGGTITIDGVAARVFANAGEGFAEDAGVGGTVVINGSCDEVYASAPGYRYIAGGNGGSIRVNSGASTGNLFALGANGLDLGGPGGNGGSIVYSLSSAERTLNATKNVAGGTGGIETYDVVNTYYPNGSAGTISTIP
jgi:hypothetical protein